MTIPTDVISKAAREIEAGPRNGLTPTETAGDVLLAAGWPEMRARIAELAQQLRIAEKKLHLHQHHMPNLCPDCRDKVPAGACSRCAQQTAERQRDAARAEADALRKRNQELEANCNRSEDWTDEIMRRLVAAAGLDWSDFCEASIEDMESSIAAQITDAEKDANALRKRVAELEAAKTKALDRVYEAHRQRDGWRRDATNYGAQLRELAEAVLASKYCFVKDAPSLIALAQAATGAQPMKEG